MSAIKFIQQHGIDKAREVIDGAPDKTATHYMFRKIPNYYSVDFQSWFHDGEWWDSDCDTEQDLIDSYGSDFVLSLSDLKRLVESVDLVNCNGGWNGTKNTITLFQSSLDLGLYHGVDGVDAEVEIPRLKQAIADYESIYDGR